MHVRLLSSRFRITTLDGVLDRPERVAEPAVVLTFDDGYADNLYAAHPIAAELGLPLTVFVTAGPVLRREPFWWDELTALVVGHGAGDSVLDIEVSGRTYSFRLGGESERIRTCVDIQRLLCRLPLAERRRALDRLAEQRAAEARDVAGRPLTPEELRQLARLPGVTIGAHTMNHPVLSALTASEQQTEIGDCRRSLEELLDRTVDLFSYPFGRKTDFGRKTRRLVAKAGFRAACTTEQGGVTRTTRPYAVPRLTVYDWPGEELLARVEAMLG
jgi:peptidoglycan/xylan/chitin deacetylase (PgdA/CDA1 family)